MLNAMIGAILNWLKNTIVSWFREIFRKREERKKDEKENMDATDAIKGADSREERDKAVRDLGNTL